MICILDGYMVNMLDCLRGVQVTGVADIDDCMVQGLLQI